MLPALHSFLPSCQMALLIPIVNTSPAQMSHIVDWKDRPVKTGNVSKRHGGKCSTVNTCDSSSLLSLLIIDDQLLFSISVSPPTAAAAIQTYFKLTQLNFT